MDGDEVRDVVDNCPNDQERQPGRTPTAHGPMRRPGTTCSATPATDDDADGVPRRPADNCRDGAQPRPGGRRPHGYGDCLPAGGRRRRRASSTTTTTATSSPTPTSPTSTATTGATPATATATATASTTRYDNCPTVYNLEPTDVNGDGLDQRPARPRRRRHRHRLRPRRARDRRAAPARPRPRPTAAARGSAPAVGAPPPAGRGARRPGGPPALLGGLRRHGGAGARPRRTARRLRPRPLAGAWPAARRGWRARHHLRLRALHRRARRALFRRGRARPRSPPSRWTRRATAAVLAASRAAPLKRRLRLRRADLRATGQSRDGARHAEDLAVVGMADDASAWRLLAVCGVPGGCRRRARFNPPGAHAVRRGG